MNTNNTASAITLNIVDPAAISGQVWNAISGDPCTRGQYATTTAWSLSGAATGEAIGLITGEGAFTRCFSIVRIDREVHVIEASGLQNALKELGYESRVAITI